MKYYYRYITKRESDFINGEYITVYPRYLQVVLTDDIEPFNKRKRIKFHHLEHLYSNKYVEMKHNTIYEFRSDW